MSLELLLEFLILTLKIFLFLCQSLDLQFELPTHIYLIPFGRNFGLYCVGCLVSTFQVIFVDLELDKVEKVLQHHFVVGNFSLVLQQFRSYPLLCLILDVWVGC
jgi:hypothetical protein